VASLPAVRACNFALATLLVAVSDLGVVPEEMQDQARNSGVVGIISFVGLCLVASARETVAAGLPPLLPRIYGPGYAAARRSLYEKLREIGLPGLPSDE
jgi:hypothetical protein